MAVAGEVARHDPGGILIQVVGTPGREGAVAIAQQHAQAARVDEDLALIGDGQIEPPVAVEVARHDSHWIRPDRVGDRRREGALAMAHQHPDRAVVATTSDGQIERPTAGEITRHQTPPIPGAIVLAR